MTYRYGDAEYPILGFGSMLVTAEAVADYLRETRKIRQEERGRYVMMFRPFPILSAGNDVLKGRKGVMNSGPLDQPLARDLPLVREIRRFQPLYGKRRITSGHSLIPITNACLKS